MTASEEQLEFFSVRLFDMFMTINRVREW